MAANQRQRIFNKISLRSLIVFALLLLSVFVFSPKLKVQNHLTSFFPSASSSSDQLFLETLSSLLQNNAANQPVLLSLKAHVDQRALAGLSNDLKQALMASGSVKQVTNATPDSLIVEHQALEDYRYLLTDVDFAHLPQSIESLWSAWQLGVVLDKKQRLADPTNQWLAYLQKSFFTAQLPMIDGVWMLEGKIGEAQAPMILILNPSNSSAVASLEKTLKAFEAAHAQQQVEIRYSSAATIAYQARKQIQSQVTFLSIVASLVVLAFLFVVFRRPVWVVLSFIPLVAASWLGALAVYALFGSVEAITLALGIVLIGVSVDYPIHVFSALLKTPKHKEEVWRVVRLGGITSAFGFLVLSILGVEGFQQIAVFSAVGLISALLISRMLMLDVLSHQSELSHLDVSMVRESPVMTEVKPQNKQHSNKNTVWMRWGGLGLLLVIVLLLWRAPLAWQDDLASLSPVPTKLLQQDQHLRQLFSQPESTQFLLLQASSLEALLQQEEALSPALLQLEEKGIIKQSLSLSEWLPSQHLQAQRVQALPSSEVLLQAIAQQQTPLTAKVLAPFIDAIEASRHLPLLTLDSFTAKALDWQKRLLPLLATQTKPSQVSSAMWTGKILLTGVKDTAALASWSKQHQVLYFNQRTFVATSVQHIRERLLHLSAAVLLVFALLLFWQQKCIVQSLDTLLPVLLGVLVTFVSLGMFEGQLSIFHLLASLLLIAIGVDYSLFIKAASDKNAQEGASTEVAKEIVHSVPIAMATTVISFGLLLFTQIPILVALGQTLVLGVPLIYLLSRLYHRF